LGLKLRLHNGLGDPIRDRRNPQSSFPSTGFRYLHRTNRRRKVTARRHPIPKFVEIVFQISLKLRNRLFVDSCCSFIRLDPLICFPNFTLRNLEWFCLVHRLLPFRVDRRIWLDCTAPSLHPFIQDFIATTSCSAPEIPHPYSRPRGSSTCGFSVSIGISGSHVPFNRLMASSGHLSCRMPLRP